MSRVSAQNRQIRGFRVFDRARRNKPIGPSKYDDVILLGALGLL